MSLLSTIIYIPQYREGVSISGFEIAWDILDIDYEQIVT
jgi:hypothetical protein